MIGSESIGEIFYRVRCSILHEAEVPEHINFERVPGLFNFSLSPATTINPFTITVPGQFCDLLHVALLGCPEYTSIPKEFSGRRIRFAGHTILPSDCIGNFELLRQQLILSRFSNP